MTMTVKRELRQFVPYWEVQWCSVLPVDEETGQHDVEKATVEARRFAKKDYKAAKRFARYIAPENQLPPTQLCQMVFDGEWNIKYDLETWEEFE